VEGFPRVELGEFIPRAPSRDSTDAFGVDPRCGGNHTTNVDLRLRYFRHEDGSVEITSRLSSAASLQWPQTPE
jgi:hypothetical protein